MNSVRSSKSCLRLDSYVYKYFFFPKLSLFLWTKNTTVNNNNKNPYVNNSNNKNPYDYISLSRTSRFFNLTLFVKESLFFSRRHCSQPSNFITSYFILFPFSKYMLFQFIHLNSSLRSVDFPPVLRYF